MESFSTFVIDNPDKIDLELLNNGKQGFMKQMDIYDEKIGIIAKQLFDEKIFDNMRDFTNRLDIFQKLTNEETVIENENDEKNMVNKFINNMYDITNNIEQKIKASEICEQVETYLENNSGNFKRGSVSFRNKLSKYLLDMGLQKKRFGDGFYYYGMVLKNFYSNIEINDNLISRLEEERTNDIARFFHNN